MTVERSRTDLLAPQMPELDTLRAVGALAVMVTHTAFWAGAYTEFGAWGSLLARMDVGVAIFFVLSGFLLSRPWIARAHAGLPSPSVPRYFWKRFLRISPVYLVTATIALLFIQPTTSSGRGTGSAPTPSPTSTSGTSFLRGSPRCGASRPRSPSTWCCPS